MWTSLVKGNSRKYGQAQEQVQFEDPVNTGDVTGCRQVEREYSLGPGHELDHFTPVQVLSGNGYRREAQCQLDEENHENAYVGKT